MVRRSRSRRPPGPRGGGSPGGTAASRWNWRLCRGGRNSEAIDEWWCTLLVSVANLSSSYYC
uniref:Uncharacterized protein n=1 Tax=Arundo donax TaxID=35708 RepID=A0A0A9AVZ1_ARUDO